MTVATDQTRIAADALSGVTATLVSLWLFYPLDVIKTNVQAGSPSRVAAAASGNGDDEGPKISSPEHSVQKLRQVLATYYRGCLWKSFQSGTSSFCYFVVHSWLLSMYKNRKKDRKNNTIKNRNNDYDDKDAGADENGRALPSATTRLFISAISAMINTMITLPLDVISSQRQVEQVTVPKILPRVQKHQQHQHYTHKLLSTSSTSTTSECYDDSNHNEVNDENDDDDDVEMIVFHEALQNDQESNEYIKSHEYNESNENESQTRLKYPYDANNYQDNHQKVDHDNDPIIHGRMPLKQRRKRPRAITNETICSVHSCLQTKSPSHSSQLSLLLQSLSRVVSKYWKGLVPALLLCANPAIHYTVYDVIKHLLLERITSSTHPMKENTTRPTNSKRPTKKLSMVQSFGVGIVAKLVATLLTYPLIRAKILMMTSNTDTETMVTTTVPSSSSASAMTTTSPSSSSSPSNQRNLTMTPIHRRQQRLTLWKAIVESYYSPGSSSSSSSSTSSSSSSSSPLTGPSTATQDVDPKSDNGGHWRNLYVGCDYQILHTVLKSGLMMMVRERISHHVHRYVQIAFESAPIPHDGHTTQ